ncbi:phox-associated domain-containing protein [Tanacetum coccineum]|uniref:Phox-associated domain-containing protein n=1 Tax=Tanacetum coccineum TaxID=301880 RepID=A0ABQ4XWD5_9ASTR
MAFAKKYMLMLMVGLEGAGKTTILYKLDQNITKTSSSGLNMEIVHYKNITFNVWDVGVRRDKVETLVEKGCKLASWVGNQTWPKSRKNMDDHKILIGLNMLVWIWLWDGTGSGKLFNLEIGKFEIHRKRVKRVEYIGKGTGFALSLPRVIVEAAMGDFVSKILQDFVLDMWYSDIILDKEAPQLIHGIIMDILAEISTRAQDINLIDLLTRDVADLVGDHSEIPRKT